MNDSSVAVRVNDLRKRYGGGFFGRNVDALRGVSFEVPKGKVFGLLGPNGAGKTTIIKILLGIVRATGGSATLLGHPAGKREGRRRVGYLPENLQMPRHQNARTALEYFGRLSGMDHQQIQRRGAILLERVGLQKRQKESIKQYSKGMRQRLGLAQALLHDPELLILDEPTDGLDPIGRSQVRDIMRELSAEGRTVFVNSHLLQEVELVCDEVAILNHGELKHIGSVEELASEAHNKSTELDLELLGDEPSAKRCLSAHQIENIASMDDGRISVHLVVRDQNEINAVVDSLRQNNVDIVALSKKKKTLEDFFLDVVNQKAFQA
jgi:ABC-2 type transport system ATP-binding protein